MVHPARGTLPTLISFWLFWTGSLITVLLWHAQVARAGWAWTTGDWLISFADGPVRRGLTGELILALTSPNLNPAWTVFLLQALVLLVIYFCAAYFFMQSSRSWTWFMLILSPAFLLFFPLSLDGSLRKESIAVACVGLMAVLISRRAPAWSFGIPILAYSLGCFAHEAVALSFPAMLMLLYIGYQNKVVSRYMALGTSCFIIVVSLSSLVLALIAPGSSEQASAICERARLATGNLEICDGAIQALGTGLRESLGVVSGLATWNVAYLGLAVLALVPFFLLRPPRQFWIFTALVYVSLTPLFLVAWDYGRWIFLATSMMTFLIAVTCQRNEATVSVPAPLALAYIALWSLPTLSLGQPSLFGRTFGWLYSSLTTWVNTNS